MGLSNEDELMRSRLMAMSTPEAADMLRKLGVSKTTMTGIRPVVPIGETKIGRARTLALLPDREDIDKPPKGPVNRLLYESITAGEVLVVYAMGCMDKAALGDMMFSRLCKRGVEAVVVDGAVRDIPVVKEMGLPIFARGSSIDSYFGTLRPWESDCDIQCGGVLVRPGDWIVADAEGIVVVPYQLAQKVVEEAEAKRGDDKFSHALLANGFGLDDAYPLPGHMRQFLSAFHDSGTLPNAADIIRARSLN
jgi:regulator of RNase E activity RraA